MKKVFLVVAIIALTISCGDTSKKSTNSTDQTDAPLVALASFDADAGKYLDKEVEVKGIVDHVCKHGGKKILLVDDNGDVHVESETRFDDALVGSEIAVKGIVTEFRVDEAYCLQKEEDHLQNHKDGTDSDEMYKKKMEQIEFYRDSMKTTNSDHISFYSLKYVSHEVTKEGEPKTEEAGVDSTAIDQVVKEKSLKEVKVKEEVKKVVEEAKK